MGNQMSVGLPLGRAVRRLTAKLKSLAPRNWLPYLRYLDNSAGLLFGGTALAGTIYLYVFYVARRVRIANDLPRLTALMVIYGNRLVIPFSFIYTVLNLYVYMTKGRKAVGKAQSRILHRFPIVEFWLFSEACFYVYTRISIKRLQAVPKASAYQPGLPKEYLRRIMGDCDNSPTGYRDWVEGWFFGSPMSEVRRYNFIELLADNFMGQPVHQVKLEQLKELQEMANEFEARAGFKFPKGHNPKLRHMRHTLEPFRVLPRPLLNYALVQVVDGLTRGYLRWLGFKRYRRWGVVYWYRAPEVISSTATTDSQQKPVQRTRQQSMVLLDEIPRRDAVPQQPPTSGPRGTKHPPPIVLLHGIGIGLSIYLSFIAHLCRRATYQAIFLIELPHISMRIAPNPVSMVDTCEGVEHMLTHHCHPSFVKYGPPPAVFIGHSYGTFVSTWIVKLKPHLVKQLIQIDPVSILLYRKNTLLNFLYKRKAGMPLKSGQLVRDYFMSTELYIVHTLCRHFVWQDNCLWAEDLKRVPNMHVLVSLGGADDLVPAEDIQTYLKNACKDRRTPIQFLVFPKHVHGTFLASVTAQTEMIKHVIGIDGDSECQLECCVGKTSSPNLASTHDGDDHRDVSSCAERKA